MCLFPRHSPPTGQKYDLSGWRRDRSHPSLKSQRTKDPMKTLTGNMRLRDVWCSADCPAPSCDRVVLDFIGVKSILRINRLRNVSSTSVRLRTLIGSKKTPAAVLPGLKKTGRDSSGRESERRHSPSSAPIRPRVCWGSGVTVRLRGDSLSLMALFHSSSCPPPPSLSFSPSACWEWERIPHSIFICGVCVCVFMLHMELWGWNR